MFEVSRWYAGCRLGCRSHVRDLLLPAGRHLGDPRTATEEHGPLGLNIFDYRRFVCLLVGLSVVGLFAHVKVITLKKT